MTQQETLYPSHLSMAHDLWKEILRPGDIIIDATCGNGYDTLLLSEMNPSKLFAIDIQEEAINGTKSLLKSKLTESLYNNITFVHASHESFPEEILPSSVKLINYNLGYLPKGDKSITTLGESTVKSLKHAEKLLKPGGLISVTCYPGHDEGLLEEGLVMEHVASLDPRTWWCCHHRWINKTRAPSLLQLRLRG